ncbi:MAG: GtrA family protein [Gammaproteobacteria bacterium]
MRRRHELMLESAKYLAAAVMALVVDVGALWFLTSYCGWNYLFAATTTFVSGGVLLYALSVNFVFGHRRTTKRTVELPSFIALGLVGLAVNLLVIRVGVEAASLSVLHAKLTASMLSFGVNFVLRRVLLFSPAAEAPPAAANLNELS